MSKYYCEYCGENDPQQETGKNTFIEINIRPYDIFCSDHCINNHINDIESGEWDNYEGGNLRLEYANEIKNNWIGYPFRLVSAESLELIKKGKIEAVTQ